jgi:outer membrane murein-binding lipoprotein Lpp
MNYDQHIKQAEELILDLKNMLQKNAFQPIPGAPAGGAPPMDPAMAAQMQGGGAPPMDPAMMAQMQGGGAPMDPAMAAQMQGGGAPPADPAQLEGIVSELMSSIEQIAGAMEQFQQQIAQLESGMQGMAQEHAQLNAKLDALEKALNAPAPAEGLPGTMM